MIRQVLKTAAVEFFSAKSLEIRERNREAEVCEAISNLSAAEFFRENKDRDGGLLGS